MAKQPNKKPKSFRVYQIVMAAIAFIMILSMVAMAIRW
jgi:hypothetical protein